MSEIGKRRAAFPEQAPQGAFARPGAEEYSDHAAPVAWPRPGPVAIAQPRRPLLTEPFQIGNVRISNRVLLAPLAGIGNWFVRLQAKRHGAGLAVSEMVSSFGLHHRNERTLRELMRIHPEEHPVSVQLFGNDPEVMRSAAAIAAEAGADLIDLNMGCPVRKVRRTGAGVELLREPGLALALAQAAAEGSGLPVTVKLRSGIEAGDLSGFDLGLRLAGEGGVSALGFHPRAATVGHKGKPDYALTRELVENVGVPVIVSGGLQSAEAARRAYAESGADGVMIARGCLGNPWLFEELIGGRENPPSRAEVLAEIQWVIDCAEEHFGAERASRYLRKFYPWYLGSIAPPPRLAEELQRSADLARARVLVASLDEAVGVG
jgi:tRNA-dihydrouridine synthase B